jgi:hypothetical protein
MRTFARPDLVLLLIGLNRRPSLDRGTYLLAVVAEHDSIRVHTSLEVAWTSVRYPST